MVLHIGTIIYMFFFPSVVLGTTVLQLKEHVVKTWHFHCRGQDLITWFQN